MDGKIRVVIIVLPGEVPFELEIPVIRFEFFETGFELGDQRFVVLFLEELVIGEQVVILLLKVQDEGLGILELGQLARDFLGFFGFIPEFRMGGLFFESLDVPLYLSGVKDDPSLRGTSSPET
jgi:hypothetical protein